MRLFGLEISRKQRRPQRMYAAAKIDRLTSDWVMSALSSNEEIKNGLKVIRDRARDLERNVDFVRRYLSMCEANVVGRGFQLSVQSVGGDDVGARKVQAAFNEWAESADVSGRLSWADIQRQAIRSVARDGEAICRILRGPSYQGAIGLQLLESDYLDENKNDVRNDGQRVVMGVTVDEKNEPSGYWLFRRHPGDVAYGTGPGQSKEYPAGDVIHVYRQERCGQTRAVSWMASAMVSLKMLQGYMEAEVVAARIAACKMGFYKIPPGENFTADGTGSASEPLSDATPGVFEQMPTGWDFIGFDPKHPTQQFGEFVKSCLRQIAGGLGVAYNNFANDLDGVSYSSIRSGTIEERQQWMVVQDWFARAFLRPVYRAWLSMASASGTLTAAEAERFRTADRWIGRRWPWVDPQSDIAAKKEEIALGLTAPSYIAAEQASDYAAVQEQIRRDNEIRQANGLPSVGTQT